MISPATDNSKASPDRSERSDRSGRSDVPPSPSARSQGLPKLDDQLRDQEAVAAKRTIVALLLLPRLGALGVAFLIYHIGDTAFYDSMLDFFHELSGTKIGYLFLMVVVFSCTISLVNLLPLVEKARAISTRTDNLRANMYLYKVHTRKPGPYVIMEDTGEVGEYNRANRSLHHFVEWSAAVALTIPFAGSVFPLPVMLLTVLFACGRVAHQIGYVRGGYGGHVGGFYIATLSSAVMEMLVLFAACKILASHGARHGRTPSPYV